MRPEQATCVLFDNESPLKTFGHVLLGKGGNIIAAITVRYESLGDEAHQDVLDGCRADPERPR